MKIRVTMKTADALDDAIHEAVRNISFDDPPELRVARKEQACALAGKWFRYGESVTLEIDTTKRTCVVMEVDK